MAEAIKIIGEAPPDIGVRPKCWWCSKPLQPNFTTKWEEVRGKAVVGVRTGEKPGTPDREVSTLTNRAIGKEWSGGYGYGDEGVFCTLRCGFYWAVNQIKGKRR